MSETHERLLVIGGGVLTLPLVERARSLGLLCAVIDGDPAAPCMALAADPVVVSTRDIAGAVAAALELAEGRTIQGVVTAGADVERTVAAIAHALGLPGPSEEAAYLCNDKAAMRRTLAAARVPGPAFAELSTPGSEAAAAAKIGLPVMVKPVDNCGSRGVIRIDHLEQLELAVAHARSLSASGSVLLEAFVDGTTHTVEMIGWRGEYALCSVIDTHHGFAPWAVELRHENPSRLPAEAQAELLRVAEHAARAVGLGQGPVKVDFLYGAGGPRVMEMTARLSGGFHCQYTTPLAHGTDNLRAAIDVCMDRAPRREDIEPQVERYAICQALFPEPGILTAISGLDQARSIPGVEHVIALARVGDELPPYRSSADRRFFAIVSGETRADCERSLSAVRGCLEIETTR